MLDLYGWESVFYVSGILSVLWAYCMWKYLLKGEGEDSYRAFGSDEWQKRKVVLHHHDQSVATNKALPARCFHIISLLFCCGILFCVRSKHKHLQSHCVRQRPLPRPRSLHSGAASRLFVRSGVGVLLCCGALPDFLCVRRAYNHAGVAGKQRDAVQTVQETLATAPQTARSLVRFK